VNNIPGVSYPIDENVRSQLSALGELAQRFQLPRSDRSNLEIVRLLGNASYSHIMDTLMLLNSCIPIAGKLVDEILKLTDPMELDGKLAELYLFRHVEQCLPGRVVLPSSLPSEKRPDMLASTGKHDIAIEVYSPTYLFGFQLVENYAIKILKYLEIDRGYELDVEIEPGTEHDLFYAYQFETEREIRPWLGKFATTVTNWLLDAQPQSVLQVKGPNESGWKLSIKVDDLHQNAADRLINQSTSTRSDDPRLLFDTGTPETTESGWWGKLVKKKMAERQAGAAPESSLLRLLVIDFSRLDTAFPDFFCWPGIVERIDKTIHLIASKLGGELPYDLVLPAWLSLSCCFGSPVWLAKEDTENRQRTIDAAGLTIPCFVKK
jgi:hypothetical protein